jgi:hypothetical protein
MPMYFFHHQKAGQLITDDEGDDLPNLAAARDEAIQSARELTAHAARDGRDVREDSFVVVDDLGQTVLILKFADALDRPTTHRRPNSSSKYK